MEVLACAVDRRMVLLFQGRLSSSTERSAAEAPACNSEGGTPAYPARLTESALVIEDRQSQTTLTCGSDLEGESSLFKGEQNRYDLYLIS